MTSSGKQHRAGRAALAAAAAAVTVGSCLSRLAQADTYIYTPMAGANDYWSTGANWYDANTSSASVPPVSSSSTELTFTADDTTVFPAGFVDTNTNDTASTPFQLATLDLNGTGPATGTATININASSGSAGLALDNQGNINLVANGSAGSLIYNVNQPLNLGGNAAIFFNHNGTATFNFNGGIDSTNNQLNVVKSGTSTLTLGGAANTSGGLYSLEGGTIRLGSSGTLGSNMGFKFYGAGGVLDLNGTNQTVAYIDLDSNSPTTDSQAFVSGTVENNGTGTSTFTINNGYQPVLQNLVDHTNGGTGVLAITTNNNVTLAATNTYSGLTTVAGGTLTVGNGATAGTLGTGNVVDNGFVNFNHSDNVTIANAISGNGGVTQVGAGILTLSGNNSYTNETYVNAGATLRLGSATALGATDNGTQVASGATLDLNGQAVGAEQLNLTGTGVGGVGALVNSSATPASLTGNINFGTGSTAVPFTVGGTGDITLNDEIGNNGNPSTITMIGTGTLTIGGASGDNFALGLVADAGTVILAKPSNGGLHAIGGGINVSGGSVRLGGSGGDQIYDGDNVAVYSGAFDTNGQSETFTGLSLAGTGIGGAGALLNSAAAASTLNPTGGTTLTGNTTIGVTQAGGSLTLSGTISNASGGAYGLTKVGAGMLTLTGSNTYTGTTVVNGGILSAGSSQAFGVNSAVTLANVAGTALDISNGGSTTIGSITGGGTAGGNVTLGGNTLTIGADNTSPVAFAGSISGSGGTITKVGTGTLTLTGSSSFSGSTNVNAGLLVAGNSSALGTSFVGVNNPGSTQGTLALEGGITLANTLQIAGPGTSGQNGALVNVSGTNKITGPVTVGGSNASPTYISADGGSLTLSGTFTNYGNGITLAGAGSGLFTGSGNSYSNGGPGVTKTGTGTWYFESANPTFSGSLHLDQGTVNFVATGLGTGDINFGGGILQYALGNTEDVSNRIAYQDNSSGVIAVDTNGNTVQFASTFANVNDNSGFSKLGAGTLELTASTGYGGPTLVTGGTLRVTGSIGSSSASVTVGDGVNASSGTLAGTGSVVPAISINKGGTITAGSGATTADTVGTLTTGGQAWNAGGTFVNKVAATGTKATNDLLTMTSLTGPTSGTFAVTVISTTGAPLAFPTSGSIVLADDTDTNASTNPFSGTPATLAAEFVLSTPGLATAPAGQTYQLNSASDGANGFELIVDEAAATPEPTSLLLLAAAVAPPLLGRRRRCVAHA